VIDKVTDCRRMEDAVKAIPDSSDLCKKIVLGQNVDDIPGTFDISFMCSNVTGRHILLSNVYILILCFNTFVSLISF